jgi:hypothetical protein
MAVEMSTKINLLFLGPSMETVFPLNLFSDGFSSNRNVKDITTKLKTNLRHYFSNTKAEMLNWYHQIVRLMELSTTFLNFEC